MSFIMQTAAWAILFYVAFDEIDELRNLVKEYRRKREAEESANLATRYADIADRIENQRIRVENLTAQMMHVENLVVTRLGEKKENEG